MRQRPGSDFEVRIHYFYHTERCSFSFSDIPEVIRSDLRDSVLHSRRGPCFDVLPHFPSNWTCDRPFVVPYYYRYVFNNFRAQSDY